MKLIKEVNEFTFNLTTTQKETIDTNLLEIAGGNYNKRRYKYYYILHLLNSNSVYGKHKETFLSTRRLYNYFHSFSLIAEMKKNLIAWGMIEMICNYSYNAKTGKKKAASYAVTQAFRGTLDCRLKIDVTNKNAKFVAKLLTLKNEKEREYTELENTIKRNLQLLTVVAPKEVIDSSIYLNKINNKDFNISTWSTGRIGNEFTNVERVNRKYLLLNGSPLQEVDIVNSQPLLAGILFKQRFHEKKQVIPQDLKDYIRDCEHGEFYNNIMNLMFISEGERDTFKKNFFELFFSSNYSKKTKLYDTFKFLYPSLAEVLHEMKKGNYKTFARQLQKIESSIIFKVYNKLDALKINALTIHDSLATNNICDAFRVQSILQDELYLSYGINASIKIKTYINTLVA